MVDTQGFNTGTVAVPVSGHLGVADYGTSFPKPSEGATLSYRLPPAYRRPGLLKEDGGFDWTMEQDGDPIVFWQDGYSIPSGTANVTVVVIFAQTDSTVMEIVRGKSFDSNGYMTVDGGGHDKRFVLFTEEIFKNGNIRRRAAPNVSVSAVKEQKSERGTVLGYEVTFKVERHEDVNGEHFGEWLITAPNAAPALLSITPSGAATGATVTIQGNGLTGTTSVQFGANEATEFDVVSNTELTAVLPAGAAGNVLVRVSTPNGSATQTYTRAD